MKLFSFTTSLALALVSGQAPGNVVEDEVGGVGAWGGSCTCPDGSVYWVGDNNDFCESLACVGGVAGECHRGAAATDMGVVPGRKVTCAQNAGQAPGDIVPEGACPPEFELRIVGHQQVCRKVHTAPHDRSCPPGFELDHHQCFKKITQEPHIKCPPGLQRQGHVCLDQKVEDPEVSCPQGFVLKNGQCVPKIMSAPVILTCPHGFSLEGGKCFKTIEVSTISECPPGLELEFGMCTDIETTVVISTCPDGFLRIPVDRQNVLCLKSETVPVTMRCPEGSVLTPDNKCRVHKRARQSRGPLGSEELFPWL